MPIYDIACTKCGFTTELYTQSLSLYNSIKDIEVECINCKNKFTPEEGRQFSPPSTVIFGEGFDTPSSGNMAGTLKHNAAIKHKNRLDK